jgi:Flp pilus assembly protein TadG
MNRSQQSRQRGQIVIITAVMLVALIGMVGLAIDSGRAYGVRAKLSAAVDAAALAAGRALAIGASDGERLANAQATGLRFYNANFPSGFLGATRNAPVVQATHDPSGFWNISVSGSAAMPVTFLSVLGITSDVAVASSGAAIRRDVDVMLVLDTSGSLANPAGTLDSLKQAAISHFVTQFAAGAGGDRVGLVSFASGGVLEVPIDKSATRGFDRTTVTSHINALTVSGSTASAQGVSLALAELNAVPVALRSSLRVLVFFSDGAPNDVVATFTRTPSLATVAGDLYSETTGPATTAATRLYRYDQRDTALGTYTDIATLPNVGLNGVALASYNGVRTLTGSPITNTRCNVNKAARSMVENVANTARSQGILVMTVGLGAALTSLEVTFCSYGANEAGANILSRLANAAGSDTANGTQPQGLYCYAADASVLNACFDRITSAILRLTM